MPIVIDCNHIINTDFTAAKGFNTLHGGIEQVIRMFFRLCAEDIFDEFFPMNAHGHRLHGVNIAKHQGDMLGILKLRFVTKMMLSRSGTTIW